MRTHIQSALVESSASMARHTASECVIEYRKGEWIERGERERMYRERRERELCVCGNWIEGYIRFFSLFFLR